MPCSTPSAPHSLAAIAPSLFIPHQPTLPARTHPACLRARLVTCRRQCHRCRRLDRRVSKHVDTSESTMCTTTKYRRPNKQDRQVGLVALRMSWGPRSGAAKARARWRPPGCLLLPRRSGGSLGTGALGAQSAAAAAVEVPVCMRASLIAVPAGTARLQVRNSFYAAAPRAVVAGRPAGRQGSIHRRTPHRTARQAPHR